MRCNFIKASGKQCKAHAMNGSLYCKAHRSIAESNRVNRLSLFALIEANNGPNGLDLSDRDLEGIDLSTDILRLELPASETYSKKLPLWFSQPTGGINLAGAVLKNVKLNESLLWRGNYFRTNFHGAHLRNCDLGMAILTEADLTQADLDRANLHDADLRDAILDGTILTNTNLSGIDFTRVKVFRNVSLYGASLPGTKISRYQVAGNVGEENDGDFRVCQDFGVNDISFIATFCLQNEWQAG